MAVFRLEVGEDEAILAVTRIAVDAVCGLDRGGGELVQGLRDLGDAGRLEERLVRLGRETRLDVGAYTTAAGAKIAAKQWLVTLTPTPELVQLRVVRRGSRGLG